MSEVSKKHFGDPIHKRPVSFGKHYIRNKKDEYLPENNLKASVGDIENIDLVAIEQKHRHALEQTAVKNNAIMNILGIGCWLVFCIALVYVGVTQLDHHPIFAIIVPVAGFMMICWLAYLKKIDYGSNRQQNFQRSANNFPNKTQRPFRKNFKRR